MRPRYNVPHVPHMRLSVVLVLLVSLLAGGCKVTGGDIDYWQRTVKGPGKIKAVLLAERYPLELREQAALALVQMERSDVNGVTELDDAIKMLKSDHPQDVQSIVNAMVPELTALMAGDASGSEENRAPTELMVRAKDAGYLMIGHASGDAQQSLIRAVVGWYATDFANRSLSGNYSVEQVVRELGAPAASQLVDALNARMPKEATIKIAELISQLGDAPTKERAGTRLVELHREILGTEYFDWLKAQIRARIGADAPDNRILAVALHNREQFVNSGTLPAMKHLASQAAVRSELLSLATTAPRAEASDPEKVRINARRVTALRALESNVTEEHLDALLALALNENLPAEIRDTAFDRVGDIRSARAIPRLWALVESPVHENDKWRVRNRAGEMVLAIGGPSILAEFMRRLPSADGIKYEPVELDGYATQISQMNHTPASTQLMDRQLRSPNWWNRVIALRYLERRGTQADIAKMQRLTSDSAAVAGTGWARLEPAVETVGKVAEASIAALQTRLAQPQAATPAATP